MLGLIARLLFLIILISIRPGHAQVNVGREYGSPRMPFVISHLAEKHQRMLKKGTSPKHNVFSKILCFKWACRNEARRNKSLGAISFSKFRKKIRKNAKKGLYKKLHPDSTSSKNPVINKRIEKPDTLPDEEMKPDDMEAVLKTDSLIVFNDFLFETNSASLKADQFPVLDSVVDFLTQHERLTLVISGHSDNTGKESHNISLSTNRAKVVAEYLIGNGIDEARVTFKGLGSSKPLATNGTENGRRKNRRVELLIHDPRSKK
jgi:outer membrane protein OmpA-like peptidoglycan-associated protein